MAFAYRNGQLVEVPDPPPPTPDEVRARKLAQLPDVRFMHETKGITVGGASIRTDLESQAKISGAYTALQNGLIASTNWKAANGWTTVTLAEMAPIAQAVAAHVAACYARERELAEALATDHTVDISTGWPG